MFRRGQWVKTTRDLQFPFNVAGQKMTVNIPAPSVGIHHPLDIEETRPVLDDKGEPVLDEKGEPRVVVVPARQYHVEGEEPKTFGDRKSGLVGLHLVDSETGFNTVLDAAVPEDALEALTDINDIPAPRRATCAQGWKPTA